MVYSYDMMHNHRKPATNLKKSALVDDPLISFATLLCDLADPANVHSEEQGDSAIGYPGKQARS